MAPFTLIFLSILITVLLIVPDLNNFVSVCDEVWSRELCVNLYERWIKLSYSFQYVKYVFLVITELNRFVSVCDKVWSRELCVDLYESWIISPSCSCQRAINVSWIVPDLNRRSLELLALCWSPPKMDQTLIFLPIRHKCLLNRTWSKSFRFSLWRSLEPWALCLSLHQRLIHSSSYSCQYSLLIHICLLDRSWSK